MSALPIASSVDISNALQADSISVGYVKNNDGEFEFIGSLISELEQHFNVSFGDRLGFFTPTDKSQLVPQLISQMQKLKEFF